MAGLLLLVFLTAISLTAQDPCVSLQASANCGDTSNTTCQSFNDVLRNLSSDRWPAKCVTVNLSDGIHRLTAPVFINATTDFSVNFVGRSSSVVSCAFNSTHTGRIYSIHINGLSTVVIASVTVYGCDRAIGLENIGYLQVNGSVFRSFIGGGALDVYNCLTTEILGCSFEDSYATSVIQDAQYRGNAGGVAIGIHGVLRTNQTKPSVLVAGSSFARNIARPDNQVTSSTLIQRRVFVGRGGGLAVYVEEDDPVIITITDCTFTNNSATTRGGGVFLLLDGRLSNHRFVLANSVLEGNSVTAVDGAGGGVALSVFIPLNKRFPNAILVSNCTFLRNEAPYGGAASVAPALSLGDGYFVTFESSVFEGNSASAYAAAIAYLSLGFLQQYSSLNPYRITNCTFQNNVAVTGGIIGVPYIPLLMDGYNLFTNNTGATLRVIGATVTLNGTFKFIGNNADNSDGGAVYITSQGQLILTEGTSMSFQGNHGRLGAAFVADYIPEVAGFTKLLYNPLCFIQYEDYKLSPFLWKGLDVTFSGNSALIGPVAYINQLDFCSWRGLTEPFFDAQNIIKWPFVDVDRSNRNLGHPTESKMDPRLYLQTPAVALDLEKTFYAVSPGEIIDLRLKALDELSHPTYAVFNLNSMDSATQLGAVFHPSIFSELPQLDSLDCTYSMEQPGQGGVINVSIYLFDTQDQFTKSDKYVVSVQVDHCPPGYLLQKTSYDSSDFGLSCMCDTMDTIVNCEPNLDSVLLKPSLWAVVVDAGSTLKTYHCPNGYCTQIHNTSAGPSTHGSLYTYDDPDGQCNCNRSGVLCGSCPQGYGVSVLTNRCVSCGNNNGFLILGLYVVVVLVTIAITLYPYPLMAGFYPCLFAIQLAPLISMEFPLSFETVHPYLYYVSSSLALYFPYDFCLFSNLNPLVSYCLRYTPPVIVVLTVVITLVIRKKALKKLRSIPWYGVWTLVILLYSQAVHTSMSVLNCPLIQDSNGYIGPRWYVDGTVECFTEGHLPLALFSILALVVEVGLILLVAMISLEKLKQPMWLHHLVQPLTHAFKEEWRWWGSMEIARRFLLVLFTVLFPGNPIPPCYILMIYTCAYAFIQPYKSRIVNILEVVLCVDLLVMLLIVGDSAILEDLLYSHTTQLSVSQIREDGCVVSGFTSVAGLLTPLYYLPLLVGLLSAAVSLASFLRLKFKPEVTQSCAPDPNQELENTLCTAPPTTQQIQMECTPTVTVK